MNKPIEIETKVHPLKSHVTASSFKSVSSILLARVSDYRADVYLLDMLQISETTNDEGEPLFVGVLEMSPRDDD